MKRVLGIAGIIVLILLLGLGGYLAYRRFGGGSGTLVVWTLAGTESAVKQVAETYRQQNPSFKIKIVPVAEQNYEFDALFALATQAGTQLHPAPDLWVVPNEWLEQHRNKLVAAPEGALSEGITRYQDPNLTDAQRQDRPRGGRSNVEVIQKDYAPIASNDLIADSKVWGVPMTMDSLVMFYDRTKLNIAPKTWREVQDVAKRFTQRNGPTITRSSVAMGELETVKHYQDILSILMLQTGTKMVDPASRLANFNVSPTGGVAPGANALDFYTSFALAQKDAYTWNRTLGNSLDALKNGKTMVAFGYASDLEALNIEERGRIAVAPLPQTDPAKPSTYGRYLAMTVTKQAKQPAAAWEFASFFANPDIQADFAEASKRIPARADAAALLTPNSVIQPFYDQIKLTTNWPKADVAVADGALTEALTLVLRRGESPQVSLDVAAKAYSTFLQRDTGIVSDPEVLSLWQPDNDVTDYTLAIRSFVTSSEANIKRIAVSRHSTNRYEYEVVSALAAREGPDILVLPNDSVHRFQPALREFLAGSFNLSDGRLDDITALERTFVPAVVTDNVVAGKLYGMPANFETLMIAYNTDLLTEIRRQKSREENPSYLRLEEKFSSGPRTWDDIALMAQIATKRNPDNSLVQPFIALGTGDNVANSADIFAVLTKQYGGDMTDPDRLVTGMHLPISSQDPTVPGEKAKNYIQSFADPRNAHYSWDKGQPYSLDAFAEGKVVATFVYPRDVAYILAKNPKINIGYYALPQAQTTGDAIDIASYYSLTLPKAADRPNEAFDFIKKAILDPVNDNFVSPQLTRQSTAINDRSGRGDPQLTQKNTAMSYYKGIVPDEFDATLRDLLDGRLSLTQAATRVNRALNERVLE